ncbi:MAG: helix-turn-helix domain-containing protein [Mesorhizobium sp.]
MLGWSQEELARAANVARQTIADFERGAACMRPQSD